MLSELRFGAFLVYSPRGDSEVSRRSRQIVMALKQNRSVTSTETMSRFLVRRLEEEMATTVLARYFDPSAVFVPVPGSSLLLRNALWPSLEIATALSDRGLGSRVLQCLRRREAVPKSAFAKRGQRLTPRRHYETLEVVPLADEPESLILVDDVVTKGSTLMGAAARLRERYPRADIRAFAAVRTLGLQPEIEKVVDPCVGAITLDGDDAVRQP